MIYRLHHVTAYDYAEPVVLGTHFMHLLPRGRPGQVVREAQLDILPLPDSRRNETDHFGNFTTTISVTQPHKQFSVALSATVDVLHPAGPAAADAPNWEAVAERAIAHPVVAEFCLASPLAQPTGAIAEYAAPSFARGRGLLDAVDELNHRLYADLTYRPGVTHTGTTAAQTLQARAGVCQDYAHFMIACLRALGLPARYVSGYLRTLPPVGGTKRRGADQSHAWISIWLGEAGWIDFDPTNNLRVRDEHVTLAWGRDFQDVSPLRGIILGGGRHAIRVNVDLDPVLT